MLELLVAIGVNVLVGALTALLIYFLWARKRRDPSLSDASAALHLFQRQFPDSDGVATLTSDRRNALIDLGDDAGVGLLQGYGQRWNARILHPGDVAAVRTVKEETLQLRFTDYGSPRASLLFVDADERAAWLVRLQALIRSAGLHHA
jgi:hypothetical protein